MFSQNNYDLFLKINILFLQVAGPYLSAMWRKMTHNFIGVALCDLTFAHTPQHNQFGI